MREMHEQSICAAPIKGVISKTKVLRIFDAKLKLWYRISHSLLGFFNQFLTIVDANHETLSANKQRKIAGIVTNTTANIENARS
jgi:hypothetical protein